MIVSLFQFEQFSKRIRPKQMFWLRTERFKAHFGYVSFLVPLEKSTICAKLLNGQWKRTLPMFSVKETRGNGIFIEAVVVAQLVELLPPTPEV